MAGKSACSADYERVSKSFQRLQQLIRTLVPVPGKPFRPADGAFIPLFRVMIHTKLRGGWKDLRNSLGCILMWHVEKPIQPPLLTIARPTGSTSTSIRPIIPATGVLSWSQIRIEIAGNQSIRFHAPSQDASHTLSRREKLRREHPLGVLMTLAAKGEWRNPSPYAPEYESVSKHSKPFNKLDGGFIRVFQIKIHSNLLERNEF
jgi:hypothetical protein